LVNVIWPNSFLYYNSKSLALYWVLAKVREGNYIDQMVQLWHLF